MNKFSKNVFLVDANQPKAALALAEMDTCGNGIVPKIYGETLVVGFYSMREELVEEAKEKAKNILDNYNLTYRETILKA